MRQQVIVICVTVGLIAQDTLPEDMAARLSFTVIFSFTGYILAENRVQALSGPLWRQKRFMMALACAAWFITTAAIAAALDPSSSIAALFQPVCDIVLLLWLIRNASTRPSTWDGSLMQWADARNYFQYQKMSSPPKPPSD